MKTVKLRLTVVTREDGRLVGTAPANPDPDDRSPGPHARLVAGPGQRVEDIEIDVDADVVERHDAAKLHARVREHLARRPPSKARKNTAD
jgi:hypothetical protein